MFCFKHAGIMGLGLVFFFLDKKHPRGKGNLDWDHSRDDVVNPFPLTCFHDELSTHLNPYFSEWQNMPDVWFSYWYVGWPGVEFEVGGWHVNCCLGSGSVWATPGHFHLGVALFPCGPCLLRLYRMGQEKVMGTKQQCVVTNDAAYGIPNGHPGYVIQRH